MKKSKIIIMLFMAIMLVATLNISVFAAVTGNGETSATKTDLTPGALGTLTVAGAEATDTFTAYEVMKVEYNQTTNELTYTPSAAFTAFLAGANIANVTTFAQYQALTDEATVKSVLGKFAAYVKANNVASSFTLTGNDTNSSVPVGQYVLTGAATTAKVFQVMTASYPVTVENGKYVYNKDVTINVKSDTPSITKTTTKKSVAIGDTVPYTVTATVPTYPEDATNKTFQIQDTMSAGLSFKNDVVVTANGTQLTVNRDYTVTSNQIADGKTSIKIDFVYNNIKAYQQLEVTYSATVNMDAVFVDNSASTNSAQLVFSNDPYGNTTTGTTPTTPTNTTTVYTYGFETTVTDATDPTKKLSNVEFEVYDNQGNPLTFTQQPNGTYIYDPNGTVTTLTTDANGKIRVDGLDLGEYELKETKTNPGYQLPGTNFPVSLTDVNNDGKLDNDPDDNNIRDLTITNAPITTVLPQTGGIGTYVFVIAGLGVMIVAVTAIIIIEKKAKRKRS